MSQGEKPGFVQSVVSTVLEGLPMKGSEFGVQVDGELELYQIAVAITRLLKTEGGVSLRVKFAVGDLYNKTPKKHGMREQLGKMVYGPNADDMDYQRLRTYGWVAKKWPVENRSDMHTWVWFLNNAPGKPEKKPSERHPTKLSLVSVDARPLGAVLLADVNGRKFSLHLPKEEVARIMNEILSSADAVGNDLVGSFMGEEVST